LEKTSPLSQRRLGRTWTSNAIGEAPCVKNSEQYGDAQAELIGKAVVLTDGKAGAVEDVCLDELHGLRISIKGHDGRWPVSTIKFVES
jgi:hypothetical protein